MVKHKRAAKGKVLGMKIVERWDEPGFRESK